MCVSGVMSILSQTDFFSYWQNQVCFRNLPIVGVACVGFTDGFIFVYPFYCESV